MASTEKGLAEGIAGAQPETARATDSVEATANQQAAALEPPESSLPPAHHSSSNSTAVPSPHDEALAKEIRPASAVSSASSMDDHAAKMEGDGFEPIKTHQSTNDPRRPGLRKSPSRMTENDLFQVLSRRRTNLSGVSSEFTPEDEQVEIERLMSRMFGHGRQEHSEEEKTRHVGVVWRDLTVKGMGLGAALQPTNGDFFLGLPRMLQNLFKNGPRAVSGKPPVRNILNDFTGCIRPGEMTLVLGRPGSGCSTFLKVLGNQRFGYEDVQGDVTYGGTSAKIMLKDFRGEVSALSLVLSCPDPREGVV